MIANTYRKYENIGLWDLAPWTSRITSIRGLVSWLEANEKWTPKPYKKPIEGYEGREEKLPYYAPKTFSLAIPEVVDYWHSRGLTYECRSQGGLAWIAMTPNKAVSDFSRRYKTLLVFHNEDFHDPYWAMRVLDEYKDINEMAADMGDLIVCYILVEKPDVERIYVNILQELFVLVPGDTNDVIMDVSTAINAGQKLSEIKDFPYYDKNGKKADPDKDVFLFGDMKLPVLDVSGRWENRGSLTREQVSNDGWSSADYDLNRVIASETGRKMMEGIELEYRFDTCEDPELKAYWAEKGLIVDVNETDYRRWISAVPTIALKEPEIKLPCVLVMQEVNKANDHLGVTCEAYFYEFFRISSQGECILINFVLEDADSNDLLVKIIDEAAERFPIDRSRIYITGHSHNGRFSLEFARRHPDLIAAVATEGNQPGFMLKTGKTMDFDITEEKVEFFKTIDLPVIVLGGYCEFHRHFPLHSDISNLRPGQGRGEPQTLEERAKSLQDRLRAFNCRVPSIEEIAATKDSPEGAVRAMGIPADKSEVLWMDGFELYICDMKNKDGKYHLRFVGEENMPHNTSPAQQALSWSFMRRFKRDPETGEIIELY